jgi:hypothetical protein
LIKNLINTAWGRRSRVFKKEKSSGLSRQEEKWAKAGRNHLMPNLFFLNSRLGDFD